MFLIECVIARLHRVGSWVLLLHDVVDVFLYSSKFFKDSKWEKSAAICFVIFTLSYAWCRLYKYGSIVILTATYVKSHCCDLCLFLLYLLTCYSITSSYCYGPRAELFDGTMKWFARYDPGTWHPIEISSRGMCLYGYCLNSFWGISLFQIVLLTMHFYWFSLVLRIVKNILISRKLGDDIREKDGIQEKKKAE